MESHSNDDRQNDNSRNNTRESRDALHDDGSAAGTSQRNNPGAASEDVSVGLNRCTLREKYEDLEKRNEELVERIRELELEQRRSSDTIRTLTGDKQSLQEEKEQLENKLREQKPQIVPSLRDKNKREELRFYSLNMASETNLYHYVIHRQKRNIKEGEDELWHKYSPAQFKASIEVPNSVAAYIHIQDKFGLKHDKNCFDYDGGFEELLRLVDEEFYSLNGRRLRGRNGELYFNL